MGYGSRALQLLQEYYELKYSDLSEAPSATSASTGASASAPNDGENENADSALHSERVEPRADLPPLLQQLSEVPPPRAPALNYVGVAFGLTHDLFRFWKRAGYIPVYLRQTSVFLLLLLIFFSGFDFSNSVRLEYCYSERLQNSYSRTLAERIDWRAHVYHDQDHAERYVGAIWSSKMAGRIFQRYEYFEYAIENEHCRSAILSILLSNFSVTGWLRGLHVYSFAYFISASIDYLFVQVRFKFVML